MQGSVLVVRESFLKRHPEHVDTLVRLTARGIDFINTRPNEAAAIVAGALDVTAAAIHPFKLTGGLQQLTVSPAVIHHSLTTKLENTIQIDPAKVQEMINYAARIGYIKAPFPATDILEPRYQHE